MENAAYRNRVAALRQILTGMLPDTAWVIQPENRRYLSGFRAIDTQFTESSGSLLINQNQCILATDSRYTSIAKEEAVDFEVRTIRQGLLEGLPELVNRMGTESLGFEEEYLTWGLHRRLTKRFKALSPPVDLVSLDGKVEGMRKVKDSLEIETLEASADMASAILDDIIAGLKSGQTRI